MVRYKFHIHYELSCLVPGTLLLLIVLTEVSFVVFDADMECVMKTAQFWFWLFILKSYIHVSVLYHPVINMF